ncbi:MAG: hypothetical protein KGL39_30380 [Patescibacteria group bacterium]|nr:hypothetical protein [Patescibacteria group bacterium]
MDEDEDHECAERPITWAYVADTAVQVIGLIACLLIVAWFFVQVHR